MKDINLRFSIAIILSLFLLEACQKNETTPLHSGVLLKNMDTLVKPGDNFHAYVNGGWIKNTKIPADRPIYGVFDMLRDQAEQDVKNIIETAAKGKFKEGSDEQKIGDFYASFIDTKARDSKVATPLKTQNERIEAIKNYSDLAAYFGEGNKIGQSVPFQISITSDSKNPKEYMVDIFQSGLGLPEREYYLQQDEKSKELRKKYIAHIAKMLTLGGYPNPVENAAKILALETLIASKHMKKEDTRDPMTLYNKYEVKDLAKLMPDFDWTGMLKTAELSGQKSVVVAQVDYMNSLNDIIKKTPLDTWKAYLNWTLIHSAAYALSTEIVNENFDFYGKTLYGAKEQRPLWRRAVSAVNENLGEIVGKLYVEKHFTLEAKQKMTILVKNLLKAYEESIISLDWMSPTTKKEALDKIKKFMLKIGYPDNWRDYSTLKVEKNDLYGNLKRSKIFEYKRNLNKLGKPVDRTEWEMTPQDVNAYYNPPLNEIVFPAAILQPPFFDINADDAANYGSIGAIIGHEIGHGFDDQGSNYDGNGVLRNWWTPEDKAAFSKRTADLVVQYNGFKVFKDLNVNGAFTLGENIGDLSGLSIALKAYKKSLNGKPGPKIDGFTAQQRVFIGYAQSWLSKGREETLRYLVAVDPHSPDKFRANGIVRNIPEFYEAFNIKPTDSLYLAPEKRVKIW